MFVFGKNYILSPSLHRNEKNMINNVQYQGPSKKQQYERKLFKERRNNIKCSYEQKQVTKIKFHFQNFESSNLPFTFLFTLN